jgi:hypothetical protein
MTNGAGRSEYERGIMLREFPTTAQDKLIELVDPYSTTLVIAELRARVPSRSRSLSVLGDQYRLDEFVKPVQVNVRQDW